MEGNWGEGCEFVIESKYLVFSHYIIHGSTVL